MKSKLMFFFQILFPLWNMWKANKTISKEIENLEKNYDINTPYMDKFREFTEAETKQFLDRTSNVRKTLDDKAKTSVLGITVSVSFIAGVAKFLFDVKDKMTNIPVISCLILIFATATLIYMIFGGYASINALFTQKNYDLSPDDLVYLKGLEEEYALQQKNLINAQNNELNQHQNRILNNYVSASYENLRNSLVCLGIMTVLMCYGFLTPPPPEKVSNTENLMMEQNSILKENQNNLHKISNNIKDVSDKVKDVRNELHESNIKKNNPE